MTYLWAYLLVFIAAFLNSCMDITEEEVHFNKSIFKNLDPRFFCKSVSWSYAKTLFGVHFDFWHICKYGCLACLFGAIVIFKLHYQWWIHYALLFGIWGITFQLFYSKILKVK